MCDMLEFSEEGKVVNRYEFLEYCYAQDAEFHSVVDLLVNAVESQAFTLLDFEQAAECARMVIQRRRQDQVAASTRVYVISGHEGDCLG